MTRGRVLSLALVLAGAWAGGCTYQRDVNYKPFFTGLAGATMRTAPTLDPARQGADPTAAAGDQRIRIENKDGSVVLVARNAQHLMRHILATLEKGERDLFTAQVLSERTRDEYAARGLDPRGAFDTLKGREKDIRELFRRMPMGEHSPNVIMEKLGADLYRVTLTGAAADDLEWTGFDMVMEGGGLKTVEKDGVPVLDKKGRPVEVMEGKNWKLVWFGR